MPDNIAEVKLILEEIKEGKGAYSLDPLTHAANCIESMKRLAQDALDLLVVDEIERRAL
jgi:hypothetical protein